MTDQRRRLPSVGKLLETGEVQSLLEEFPRTVVLDALRDVLDHARNSNTAIAESSIPGLLKERIEQAVLPTLRSVINATGVVLHTNLGRAPLAQTALDAIRETASGYTNLEYDVASGTRGSRYSHCVELLCELTGAEDAIVVNNCAAALVLSLATLSAGRDAIISRGELVEIGGSFRIPDIMRASGANLLEVGTTNRTHVDDYVKASGPNTGAFVKVHRSNFTVNGFVAEVGIDRLAPVASERDIPVIHDLGSGLLVPLDTIGLSGEPLARDAVRAGATLVLMSGDKLLGGPQAGIIVGKASAVARVKTNPLTRAMRVDKLTIAALSATLQLYRDPVRALREIPILSMLAAGKSALEKRANGLCSTLSDGGVQCSVVSSASTVGAGAFPQAELESAALAFDENAGALEKRLRDGATPVIGRLKDGKLLLDMRSVLPSEDNRLADMILAAAR
jgi:L-seryl-tRNA(Ser) seleniumtransferase